MECRGLGLHTTKSSFQPLHTQYAMHTNLEKAATFIESMERFLMEFNHKLIE
jgi:hypothetical protein